MKGSGEAWALGAVAALAAGAAWRGRGGGRNLDLARERQIWNWLMIADLPVLNATQVKGLERGEFLLPDGSPGGEGQILLLTSEKIRVRAQPKLIPTLRGREAAKGATIHMVAWARERFDSYDVKLLILQGEEEDLYFLFPDDVTLEWGR